MPAERLKELGLWALAAAMMIAFGLDLWAITYWMVNGTLDGIWSS
jgi:hypothetical protein